MWGVVLCVVACGLLVCRSEDFGEGGWVLHNMDKCPDPELYQINFKTEVRKMNRTHDAISVKADLPEPIDETYGVYLDVCKQVDGGCKTQYQYSDASFCNTMKEFAKENFEQVLLNAGLADPDCPIPMGEHEVTNYMVNYEELEGEYMFGEYEFLGYLMKGGQRVSCTKIFAAFKEIET